MWRKSQGPNVPGHSGVLCTLSLTETPMSADSAGLCEFTSSRTRVHRDGLVDDQAIADEFSDGLAGVRGGDFVDLIGIKPDLAFTAADNGSGQALLSAKVDPIFEETASAQNLPIFFDCPCWRSRFQISSPRAPRWLIRERIECVGRWCEFNAREMPDLHLEAVLFVCRICRWTVVQISTSTATCWRMCGQGLSRALTKQCGAKRGEIPQLRAHCRFT